MIENPDQMACRTVAEWAFCTQKEYVNPFIDVTVDVEFIAPDGHTCQMPAFYDGDHTWKVRFNPGQPGIWSYRIIISIIRGKQ